VVKAEFHISSCRKNTKSSSGLNATDYSLSPGIQKPIGAFSETVPKFLETEQAIEPSLYLSDEYEYSPRLCFQGALDLHYLQHTDLRPNTSIYLMLRDLQTILTDTVFYRKGQIFQVYPGLEFRFHHDMLSVRNCRSKADISVIFNI